MMTAEQFHRNGYGHTLVHPVEAYPFAESYAAAQLAEKEREIARLETVLATWQEGRAFEASRAEAAEERLKEAQAEIKRVHKLFGDLTPGGSEFAGDPDYCAKYLQQKLETQGELLKKKVIALRQREAELEQRPARSIGKHPKDCVCKGDGILTVVRPCPALPSPPKVQP